MFHRLTLFLLASSSVFGAGLSLDEGRKLWAMIPPQIVPGASIDGLIDKQLAEKKLVPNAAASRSALVRRLYLDLTGLPPTDMADKSDLADVVDALLKSPHFGERWGRHWLDIARYADSNGRDRNVMNYHAWRYRDYVIASLNADKPYDVFIQEQIAGDLMPTQDTLQRNERLTATAFLALGAKAFEESKQDLFHMDVVDEQIEMIGRGVLGLSVACARCHDHKFDPIPTADYYAIAGILRSTQPLYGHGPRGIKATMFHHTDFHPLGDEGAQKLAPAALAYFTKLDADILTMQTARSSRYGVWRRVNDAKRLVESSSGEAKTKAEADLKAIEAQIADWDVKIKKLEADVEALKITPPPQPAWTMGARDRSEIMDCRIHIRGETTTLGDTVPRGFLQVISLPGVKPPAKTQSGRLELAQWLTHRGNPLTARVMVNRVWQKLFGRALVTTPDDFGVNSAKPSHPELLDYLAVRFMEQGWSVKKLIREIVLSKAYQRSTDQSVKATQSDPDNIWLWRMSPRPVEVEVLRDSILALSGQLDPYPPQKQFLERFHPQKDAELFTFTPFLTADAIVDHHRSVYLPIVRGTLPEMFPLFNFAPPERPMAQREESIVPAQSLFLMNNAWVLEQARHTATRLLSDTTIADDSKRLDRLYERAFFRAPTPAEQSRALAYLKTSGPETAWTSLCQTVIASAEFRVVR
ncbi:MAG: DUF1549 and DUF1553 domain-containing protein [Prosthecobacter sp.]|uniref:DUF1549 and DUF1553 domain-containing protein n=1 Tax=Prosthecobacter sp. TaxID=1965333 RepID=UPI0039027940